MSLLLLYLRYCTVETHLSVIDARCTLYMETEESDTSLFVVDGHKQTPPQVNNLITDGCVCRILSSSWIFSIEDIDNGSNKDSDPNNCNNYNVMIYDKWLFFSMFPFRLGIGRVTQLVNWNQ